MGRWLGTAEQQAVARQIRHAPNEVGRTWTPVSQADGTCRILGALGGCDAHALSKIAHPDRSDHRTFGE